MNPIQAITIPQPCQQPWQNMTTAGNGRYCDHCCKTVIDFSVMSNHEIVTHLQANSNVCGRFEKQQLDSFATNLFNKHSWKPLRKYMLMAASLIGLVPTAGAKANITSSQPIDSLHKKQVIKHANLKNIRALKRKATTVACFKPHGKTPANTSTSKVNRYREVPYDDDAMVGKVIFCPPLGNRQVKNFQIIRNADTVSHVIGAVVKGITIER